MNNSPPTAAPPALLTVAEAAAVLHLSVSTMYRWSCTGRNEQLFVRMPGAGTGARRTLRVHPERLAEFITRGSRG